MNLDEFDAHFDRFTSTACRVEALQHYADPAEAHRVDAFRQGLPRPERSVRTSPWLARVALTTLASGKQWQRIRVVEEPLSDYTRYELAGYVESQAAGERILIARRSPAHELTALRRDFWLFDRRLAGAFAVLIDYDAGGQYRDAELVTAPAALREMEMERELALRWAVPLNEYLAGKVAAAA